MAISELDDEEILAIRFNRFYRCILFLFVSIPSATLLYKYIEYWDDDGPYQSTIGVSWLLFNLITVSTMIYGEFFGLKLDRRSTQLYYFITIFALCGLCDYLSAVLYVKLLPYHRKDVPPYIHIFWIVGAILYILVNMYNHLILIYDTIKESKPNRSLQVAETRVSFYVVFMVLCMGNLLIMIFHPAVRLRELITANIILWSTIMGGTSMLSLKEDDDDDIKQHKLINFFRRYSMFTDLKIGLMVFVMVLLTYSIPVLIYNDAANSSPDPDLQHKIFTYIPLMAWIFIFAFVRDACLMQRINQFWSRKDHETVDIDESSAMKKYIRKRQFYATLKRLTTIEE